MSLSICYGKIVGFSNIWENDFPFDSDRYYTNGIQFTLFDESGNTFGIGQKIYTPRTDLLDRKYAAHSYIYHTRVHYFQNLTVLYGLSLGLTGPIAKGEEVQNYIHTMIGIGKKNWNEGQTKNRLLISSNTMIAYILKENKLGFDYNLYPKLILNLGTPFVRIIPSLEFRVGYNLDNDLQENRITLLSLKNKSNADFSFYVFAEFLQNVVFNNVLLNDYNRYHNGYVGGGTIRYKKLSLKYSVVYKTKEFLKQFRNHKYFSGNIHWDF
ncbi:MAG: lipid A deacylase LpxR family protein [Rickettsiales bacterium]|jgi:hypothetical protein|nr:lipid A deacylase LpxR family protein [Rickettsiales bacterium]